MVDAGQERKAADAVGSIRLGLDEVVRRHASGLPCQKSRYDGERGVPVVAVVGRAQSGQVDRWLTASGQADRRWGGTSRSDQGPGYLRRTSGTREFPCDTAGWEPSGEAVRDCAQRGVAAPARVAVDAAETRWCGVVDATVGVTDADDAVASVCDVRASRWGRGYKVDDTRAEYEVAAL